MRHFFRRNITFKALRGLIYKYSWSINILADLKLKLKKKNFKALKFFFLILLKKGYARAST